MICLDTQRRRAAAGDEGKIKYKHMITKTGYDVLILMSVPISAYPDSSY